MAAEPDADPFDELTAEEKRRLVEIAKGTQPDEVSRRDALKAAGILGGGALLGGGASAAALEATGQASAGTNESGTVGTSTNPVDVEAEDINSTTLTTDEVEISDDPVIAFGAFGDGDSVRSYRNADKAQAVKDAIADMGATGGTILLPGGLLSWDQEVDISGGNANLKDGTSLTIMGQGMVRDPNGGNNTGGTILDASAISDGNAAIATGTTTDRCRNRRLANLSIVGADPSTGSAGSTNPNGIEMTNLIADLNRVQVSLCDTGILADGNDLVGASWEVNLRDSVTGIDSSSVIITESDIDMNLRTCTGTPAGHLGTVKTSSVRGRVESNDADGLYVDSIGPGTDIEDIHFEDNAKNGNTEASDLWIKDGSEGGFGPAQLKKQNGNSPSTKIGDATGGTAVSKLTIKDVHIFPDTGSPGTSLTTEQGGAITAIDCRFEGAADFSALSRTILLEAQVDGTETKPSEFFRVAQNLVEISGKTPEIFDKDLRVHKNTANPGSDTDPAIELGDSGAGFFIDSNGDVNVVHEDGSSNKA